MEENMQADFNNKINITRLFFTSGPTNTVKFWVKKQTKFALKDLFKTVKFTQQENTVFTTDAFSKEFFPCVTAVCKIDKSRLLVVQNSPNDRNPRRRFGIVTLSPAVRLDYTIDTKEQAKTPAKPIFTMEYPQWKDMEEGEWSLYYYDIKWLCVIATDTQIIFRYTCNENIEYAVQLPDQFNKKNLSRVKWYQQMKEKEHYEDIDFKNPRLVSLRDDRLFFISGDNTFSCISLSENYTLHPIRSGVEAYFIFTTPSYSFAKKPIPCLILFSDTSQEAYLYINYALPATLNFRNDSFEEKVRKFHQKPSDFLSGITNPAPEYKYYMSIAKPKVVTIKLLNMEGEPEEESFGLTSFCTNDWGVLVQCCYHEEIGNTINLYSIDKIKKRIMTTYNQSYDSFYFEKIENIKYTPYNPGDLQKKGLLKPRNLTLSRAIFRGQFVGQGILSSSIHLILLMEPSHYHLVYYDSSESLEVPAGLLHSNQRYSPDPDTELYSYVQLNSTEFILNGWNFCAKYKLSL